MVTATIQTKRMLRPEEVPRFDRADLGDVFTPDYMVGYAGVALCLLRLSDPERQPHQLSLRGFRHRLAPAGARYLHE